MPAPPTGLTVGSTDPPLDDLCPGISFLDTIVPITATHQIYGGDPTFGPFAAINIYELASGEADAIIGRYDQAVIECADYTATLAAGGNVIAGYTERDLGTWGDESHSYGNAGTVDGFAIDSDIVLIKRGDNLAVVTSLHILAEPDGTVVGFADAADGILAALGS